MDLDNVGVKVGSVSVAVADLLRIAVVIDDLAGNGCDVGVDGDDADVAVVVVMAVGVATGGSGRADGGEGCERGEEGFHDGSPLVC